LRAGVGPEMLSLGWKDDSDMSIQVLFSRHVVPLRRCSRPAAGDVPKAAIAANLGELWYGR
jgi:hypothetical protein